MIHPLRMLLVEDSAADAELILGALRTGGFEPTCQRVETADAFRAALTGSEWDIVLCDYRLPQFDARAALQIVKSHNPELPFLIISGAVGEETAVAVMKEGAQDFISKRHMERLTPAIQRELQRSAMHRTLRETEKGYREVFDGVSDAVFIHDATTGNVLDVNRAALEMYGCTREEMLGPTVEKFSDGMPPFSLCDAERWIRRALEEGPQLFEWLAKRHNGERFWVEVALRRSQIGGQNRVLASVRDITRHRQADEALRREHERAESYLRLAGVIMVAIDPNEQVTMINRKGLEILGWPENNIVGHNWFDHFVPPEYRERLRALFRQMMKGEIAPQEYHENEILTQPSERRLIAWHNTILYDRDGRILGTLSSGEDITERHQMEESWRASEQRFRLLMEHAQDGIGMTERTEYTTADGTRRYKRLMVFCNDRLVEMSGRSREELRKSPDLTLFTRSANTPAEQAAYRKRRDAGQPYGGVSSWLRPDGKENYFEWISVPLHIGGKLYTLEIDRDITQRRRAEQQLLLQSSALEAAANSIVITDRTGHIVWVNPAFTRLTGYDANDVIGRNPRLLKSGKHSREFYQQMWDTILTGRVWHGELVNKHKDGHLYHEETTITPVYGATGQITHFIAIKQDVTERHELEEQLRQSNKMEAIGRLAGGVAHDFNNILTAIMGYNEIMLRQLPQYDPLRREAVEIEKASYRAAQLTRQLLAFSRKQTLQPAVLNLNRVVADISHMIHRLLGENILLRTNLTEPLGNIKADPGQIEQIVLNLSINARDAMFHGGTLTIATDHATLDEEYASQRSDVNPGQYVLLSVTDTGVGMTPDVQEHLFEPFFTTKEQGRGTGLGLATCYGIAKQSGGHIAVYSEPSKGTCVKVYLPRLPGEPVSIEPGTVGGGIPRGTETVLVVEDEPALRDLAATVLREQGYTVLTASNGVEALRLLDEPPLKNLDLLLTDVVMPQMGGRELAAQLHQKTPALKVLFTSGYTPDTILDEGPVENGTLFLQKPYTTTTLARKVRELLDQPAG